MSQEKYTQNELSYILLEFNRLEKSRAETIKPDTIKEWINSFAEMGFSAEHACRMVRKVRMYTTNFKLKFADFTYFENDCAGMDMIIPKKILQQSADRDTTRAELESINYSARIANQVRQELNISYIDFLNLREINGYNNSESFIEFLKQNPDRITCDKIGEQKRTQTIAESIRSNF